MNVRLLVVLLLLTAVIGLCLATLPHMRVWEDGSWALGTFPYVLKGCLPFSLCS